MAKSESAVGSNAVKVNQDFKIIVQIQRYLNVQGNIELRCSYFGARTF